MLLKYCHYIICIKHVLTILETSHELNIPITKLTIISSHTRQYSKWNVVLPKQQSLKKNIFHYPAFKIFIKLKLLKEKVGREEKNKKRLCMGKSIFT